MKVALKAARSLSDCARLSSAGLSTRSILLSTSTLGARTAPSSRRIASSSSAMPLRASTRSATMSASWVLPQAVPTMARSSRRRGAKMPGVSTKMSCAPSATAMPRISARVVCTFGVTIETLLPTSALISVDLPALGAPINATKPQRVTAPLAAGSGIEPRRLHAFAHQHRRGGGLFGGALGTSQALGGRKLGKLNGDAEFRVVIGSGARNLPIGGSRQAARLRPFLQDGLGIALRRGFRLHADLPQPFHHLGGGLVAAIEINRADQRLADVGENRRPPPRAGIGFRGADPDRGAEID